MAASTPNKILIQVNSEDGSRPIFENDKAAEAITPGQFVEMDASETIVKNTADGTNGQPVRLAVENTTGDDATASAIDNTYAIGENVRYIYPQRGDLVYAYIKASETLVKGRTLLCFDGAGALKAITPDATTVEGTTVAVSEVDVTVGVAAARQLVRII